MAALVHPIPDEIKYLFQPSAVSQAVTRLGFRTSSVKKAAAVPYTGDEKSKPEPVAEPKEANLSDTPSEDEVPDLVSLLGPTVGLDKSLNDTVQSYSKVSQAFSGLFSFPYLDNLYAHGYDSSSVDDTTAATAGAKTMNTRELLLRGNSNFRVFSDTEITLCRNLSAYGTLVDTLLGRQTVASFAESVTPIVNQYAAHIETLNEQKADTLHQLNAFLETLNETVASTTEQLGLLVYQIEVSQSQLNRLDVSQTLLKLFRHIFLLDDDDANATIQLSVLLGLAADALEGTFDAVLRNKTRLRALVANLKTLHTRLQAVHVNLSAVAMGLADSIEAGHMMASVWTDVSDNLDQLALLDGYEGRLGAAQLTRVTSSWKSTKQRADQVVRVLSGAVDASARAASLAGDWNWEPNAGLRLPTSPAELKVFSMAREAGVDRLLNDPKKFKALRGAAANAALVDRVREKTMSSLALKSPGFARIASVSNSEDDDAMKELEQQIGYLGPPADVLDALDTLSQDCIGIKRHFSSILQTPSLSSLSMLNPFKTQDTPNEPAELDLRSIVVRYQTMYDELQTKSITCVRSLISFSNVQIAMLPNVTPFTPYPGQVSLEKYLAAADKLVEGYKDDASALSATYIKFGQDWKLAMDNLEERINKCAEDARSARDNLKKKQDEYKNMTLKGVLGIFGALALFAIGAFTLPFGLIAIAGGVVLLGFSIKELVDRGDLDTAISNFQSAITAAETTKKSLEVLREPMQKVAASTAKLSKIWSDITQVLTDIWTFMQTWAVVTSTFTLSSDKVVEDWKKTKQLCLDYVDVISGATTV